MKNQEVAKRGRGRPRATRTVTVAVEEKKSTAQKEITSTNSAIDQLQRTIEQIDRSIAAAENDPAVSAAQIAALYNAKASAVHKLARFRGEDEVTMQQIVRSSIWREFLDELEIEAEKYPEAALLISTVCDRLHERCRKQ